MNVPQNALFVCFGCLSNVGTLTGLAGLEVVKQAGPGKAGIFCLGGLATEAQMVLDKTRAAERIITVDGCPLNCARKIVERAGFTPDRIINLVQDCGLEKGPPPAIPGMTFSWDTTPKPASFQQGFPPFSGKRQRGSLPLSVVEHFMPHITRVFTDKELGWSPSWVLFA
jgi:uncharacterized metal-binding protein